MSKYFKNILKASTLIFIYLLLLILIPLDLEHGPKVLTPENMGSILHGSYRNPRMKFNDFSMTLTWHFLGPFQVVTV